MDGNYCHCHVPTKCNENSTPVGSLHKLVVMIMTQFENNFRSNQIRWNSHSFRNQSGHREHNEGTAQGSVKSTSAQANWSWGSCGLGIGLPHDEGRKGRGHSRRRKSDPPSNCALQGIHQSGLEPYGQRYFVPIRSCQGSAKDPVSLNN
jgi:hypothetical protein